MTTTTYSPALYTGNNTTPTYSFSFKIFDDADLRVVQTDTNAVESVLVLGTDYTVTGAGIATGGTITLTAGNLATGYKLKIGLGLAITQPTSIRNQSAYYASVHEDVFDRLTKIDQQQQGQLDRVPMIREGLTGVDMAMPDPVAGAAIGWNATLDGLGNILGQSSGTIQDAKALTLADLASTASGKGDALIGVKSTLTGGLGRTQHDKNADIVDARDFGAPDGSAVSGTHDQAIIEAAVTALATAGGVLIVPYGFSQLVELASLSLSDNVLIQDLRWAKHDGHHAWFSPGRDHESRIEGLATDTGEGPSLVLQNFGTQDGMAGTGKNLTAAVIWRTGPKASQKVQGVLRCGVADSAGVWVNDIDISPTFYSTLAQDILTDPALTRSRLRIGRRGAVIFNPGVSATFQDTDAAMAAGYAYVFNSASPINTPTNLLWVKNNGQVGIPGSLVLAGNAERIPGITKIANGASASVGVTGRYNYITTTAAALTINLPAASSTNDGMIVTVVLSASVATLTWASSGGSVLGAPAAGAADTPYSFIYSEASGGQWLPFK